MKKLLFIYLLFICSATFAQTSPDTLAFKRKIFFTEVYRNGALQNNKKLKQRYKTNKSFESERLLHRSKILTPAGAIIGAGGIYLGTDALIGTKLTTVIDNQTYTYYKRPVFQLLGGIGLLAAGICMMEFGNDSKIKSVNVYNKKIRNTELNTKVGVTKSGNIGISVNL